MKHVSIEIIQKCPNQCIHCSSCAGMDCETMINGEVIKKTLEGLKELDVEELSISGGEPFLHKELVEIVKWSKAQGFKVNIYTSGLMLDEQGKCITLRQELLKQLQVVGVDKIIFNLQSLKEEVYDAIMGTKGNLPLLKAAIKQTKSNNIYTELHFVPMKVNCSEIEEVIKFVKAEKIDRVSFLGLLPHGRAKENKERLYLDYKTNLEVKEQLSKISHREGERVRVGIPL